MVGAVRGCHGEMVYNIDKRQVNVYADGNYLIDLGVGLGIYISSNNNTKPF